MTIDWSKAPADATYWGPESSTKIESFYKFTEGGWFCASVINGYTWKPLKYGMSPERRANLVERPGPWSGEGLPPVGTVCEYFWGGFRQTVEIIAHWRAPAAWVAVFVPLENGVHATGCGRAIADAFAPVRTPEQIAADEREKAIADMARVISSKVADWRAAESLYDLGYRKVGDQ